MSDSNRAPSAKTAPTKPEMGANGQRHKRLDEIQRRRILAGTIDVTSEHGANNITIAQIADRAGVSRRTFYELYHDREDCLLASVEDALERLTAHVIPAYEQQGTWHTRVRAGLVEMLAFVDADRGSGRLLIVETLGLGSAALAHRARVLTRLVAVVDEGRAEGRVRGEVSRLTAEGVVGAVLSVLHGRLLEGGDTRLLELTNPLMSMIVLPYLGSAAARRELSREVPTSPSRPVMRAANQLRRLEMRLTYRTVRVLQAVASNPGGSNRGIGDAAGIGDQGQISKLLARLEKLGLVSNVGLGPGRGAPNAWWLTERGQEVRGTFAGQAGSV